MSQGSNVVGRLPSCLGTCHCGIGSRAVQNARARERGRGRGHFVHLGSSECVKFWVRHNKLVTPAHYEKVITTPCQNHGFIARLIMPKKCYRSCHPYNIGNQGPVRWFWHPNIKRHTLYMSNPFLKTWYRHRAIISYVHQFSLALLISDETNEFILSQIKCIKYIGTKIGS